MNVRRRKDTNLRKCFATHSWMDKECNLRIDNSFSLRCMFSSFLIVTLSTCPIPMPQRSVVSSGLLYDENAAEDVMNVSLHTEVLKYPF